MNISIPQVSESQLQTSHCLRPHSVSLSQSVSALLSPSLPVYTACVSTSVCEAPSALVCWKQCTSPVGGWQFNFSVQWSAPLLLAWMCEEHQRPPPMPANDQVSSATSRLHFTPPFSFPPFFLSLLSDLTHSISSFCSTAPPSILYMPQPQSIL